MKSLNNNPHLLTSVDGQDRLAVFEPLLIDRTLPKYAVTMTPNAASSGQNAVIWTVGATSNSFSINGVSLNSMLEHRPGLLERLWIALADKINQLYITHKTVPVQETFEAIMGRGRKLEVLVGRLAAHTEAIKEAKAMGQTALAESLEKRTKIVEVEAILFAGGHREFIEEQDLIRFAKECERGLRLDYLKNFVRLIPQSVRVKKTRADLLRVFDAYVILHYDPDSKGAALTEKEIEKKRDPIMFGLIDGSRRLYHVGSWTDQYCDLTFADLIDKFGEKTLTLE